LASASTSYKRSISSDRWSELLERPGIPEALLTIITFIVYARSLTFGFVYDDHGMVEHPFPLSWENIALVFSNDSSLDHASNFYRPLTIIWQGFVGRLSGSSPVLWHLSGILLHLVCVVLVFHLACKLVDSRVLATFATAVFALHPTHVEAVTWIADAADVLLTIFLLISCLALLRWLKSESPGWWVVSWLFAAACCFVKETGVVVPVLLLTLAFNAKSKVSSPARILAGFAYFAGSFGFLVLRSQVLHGFAHPLSGAGDNNMFLTEPAAVWFYVSHLVFPWRLGPCYPVAFVSEWRSAAFIVPLVLVIAILAGLAWIYRYATDRGKFWFCVLWILAPLAPPLYLKLFPAFELVHDRYLYIPSIALGIALATMISQWEARSPEHLSKTWPMVAMVLAVTAAAAQTVAYQGVWKSDTSLFQRAVELTPDNDRALVNLGVNKLMQGDVNEGTALLKRAVAIQPRNAMALFDLGNAAWNSNDLIAAESYVGRAVDIEARPKWMVFLSGVELKLGKLQDAELAARQAIAESPSEPGAHFQLGVARLAQGDPTTAVREFGAELEMYPENIAARQALQAARAQLQQHQ
jgi:tetratricopeptide (TPR) repeat protein